MVELQHVPCGARNLTCIVNRLNFETNAGELIDDTTLHAIIPNPGNSEFSCKRLGSEQHYVVDRLLLAYVEKLSVIAGTVEVLLQLLDKRPPR